MSYQIIVSYNKVETARINYDTRPQAVKYLERLLAKFPSYATPITTDLDQLSGVSVPFVGSLYMIKKSKVITISIKAINNLIAKTYPNGAPEWILRDMEVLATLANEMINAKGLDKKNFYLGEIQSTKEPIIRELKGL